MLLPRPGHLGQPKWVGFEGTINPKSLGKPKNYTHKMTINLSQDARPWLDRLANAEQNSWEGGRWGIRAEQLEEFNSMVESITVTPR